MALPEPWWDALLRQIADGHAHRRIVRSIHAHPSDIDALGEMLVAAGPRHYLAPRRFPTLYGIEVVPDEDAVEGPIVEWVDSFEDMLGKINADMDAPIHPDVERELRGLADGT